jgi:hypothetical protein
MLLTNSCYSPIHATHQFMLLSNSLGLSPQNMYVILFSFVPLLDGKGQYGDSANIDLIWINHT